MCSHASGWRRDSGRTSGAGFPTAPTRAQALKASPDRHAYVREHYLGDVHLVRYAKLLATLTGEDLSLRHR
jgi:hypothetical protein